MSESSKLEDESPEVRALRFPSEEALSARGREFREQGRYRSFRATDGLTPPASSRPPAAASPTAGSAVRAHLVSQGLIVPHPAGHDPCGSTWIDRPTLRLRGDEDT
jgi:hypothetical protein